MKQRPLRSPLENKIKQDVLVSFAQTLRNQNYHFITVTPLTHERIWQRQPQRRANRWTELMGWNWPVTLDAEAGQPVPSDWLHWLNVLAEAGWLEPAEGVGKLNAPDPASSFYPAPDRGSLWRSRVRLSSLPTRGGELLLVHGQYPTVQDDAVFFGPDTYRFARALEGFFQDHDATHPSRPTRAVELCAGAAPAALMIRQWAPECEVLAGDINTTALTLAQINARINGLAIHTLQSNLLKSMEGDFDLIVANPPYLMDGQERTYRHGGVQLLGAELALRIVSESLPRLRQGGSLLLYTGVAMTADGDAFWTALQKRLSSESRAWTVDYQMLDPDVFGEELDTPAYASVERIAAVWLCITCAERPARQTLPE